MSDTAVSTANDHCKPKTQTDRLRLMHNQAHLDISM
jgi:hypothetical protein